MARGKRFHKCQKGEKRQPGHGELSRGLNKGPKLKNAACQDYGRRDGNMSPRPRATSKRKTAAVGTFDEFVCFEIAIKGQIAKVTGLGGTGT
mgnify:CR=1 FL=1